MPLPPALAKKLATRGILTENEGKNMCAYLVYKYIILKKITKKNYEIILVPLQNNVKIFLVLYR